MDASDTKSSVTVQRHSLNNTHNNDFICSNVFHVPRSKP